MNKPDKIVLNEDDLQRCHTFISQPTLVSKLGLIEWMQGLLDHIAYLEQERDEAVRQLLELENQHAKCPREVLGDELTKDVVVWSINGGWIPPSSLSLTGDAAHHSFLVKDKPSEDDTEIDDDDPAMTRYVTEYIESKAGRHTLPELPKGREDQARRIAKLIDATYGTGLPPLDKDPVAIRLGLVDDTETTTSGYVQVEEEAPLLDEGIRVKVIDEHSKYTNLVGTIIGAVDYDCDWYVTLDQLPNRQGLAFKGEQLSYYSEQAQQSHSSVHCTRYGELERENQTVREMLFDEEEPIKEWTQWDHPSCPAGWHTGPDIDCWEPKEKDVVRWCHEALQGERHATVESIQLKQQLQQLQDRHKKVVEDAEIRRRWFVVNLTEHNIEAYESAIAEIDYILDLLEPSQPQQKTVEEVIADVMHDSDARPADYVAALRSNPEAVRRLLEDGE